MKKHIAQRAILLILTSCIAFPSLGQGVLLKFGVNAGGCSGRGVCSTCADPGIGVTFSCDTTADGTVTGVSMKFDLSEEERIELAQDVYWAGYPKAYTFDFPLDISKNNPALSALNLKAGTTIPAGWPFDVQYGFITSQSDTNMQDISTTMTITPKIAQPVTAQVVFGYPWAQYPLIDTIISIDSVVTLPVNYAGIDTFARSIPVTFFLDPGYADTLVLTFRDDSLWAAQWLKLSDLVGSKSFRLNYPQLKNTGLPGLAYFAQNGTIRFSKSTGQVVIDSIFIPYLVPVLPFSSHPILSADSLTLIAVDWETNYTPVWAGSPGTFQFNFFSVDANGTTTNLVNTKLYLTYNQDGSQTAAVNQPLSPGNNYYYTLTRWYGFNFTGSGSYGCYRSKIVSQQYPIPKPVN